MIGIEHKSPSRLTQITVSIVVVVIVGCAIANHFGLLVNPFIRPEDAYYQSGVEKLHTMQRSNLVSALKDLDKAIALNPQSSKAYVHRAIISRVQGMPLESMADLNKAIALDATNAEAYFERAANLASLGKKKEAMADLNQSLALKPDYFEAHAMRGLAYKELQAWEKALTDLNQAIALKPATVGPALTYDLYENRGSILLFIGRLDEALADFEATIKIRPDSGQAYRNRGFTYLLKDEIKPGVADFTQSMILEPNFDLKAHMLVKFQQKLDQLTDPEAKAALEGLIEQVQAH